MARGNNEILANLEQIVGPEYVSNEEADLQPYTWDMTWAGQRMPDYVVMPKTVTEIQRVVRLANHRKIPVIPYCNGTNIGGTLRTRGRRNHNGSQEDGQDPQDRP